MKFKRSISAFLLLAAMFAGGIFFAHPTIAATNAASANLQTFAETAGFATTATIPIIITRLIRTFLSFLGIIAVVIVLYGGFMYMTAGGNDDRVKKAKKVLLNAVIGIVLILSAFGIVQFILGKLGDVTGTGGSSVVVTGCVGSKCNNYVSSHPVFTVSMNSSCDGSDGALKNYKPQLVFTQPIAPASTSRIRVTKDTESDPTKQEVNGTFTLLNAKTAVFTPAETCTEDASLHCFDAGTAYTITVASSLESSGGDKLSCTTASPCVSHFVTGNKIDKAPPTVTIGFPGGTAASPGSVYTGAPTGLQAIAFDDSGASTVNFYVSNTFISSVVKTGASVAPLYTDYFLTQWDTSSYQSHRAYRISADAMDCAGNVSRRSPDSLVYLYPAICNTASLSAIPGGSGAVCGGDKTSPNYCGACNKTECKVNADCASNFCVNGFCASVPVIESVSPDNGAVNNLVTISGKGFGSVPGTVDFLGVRGKSKTTSAYSCNGATKWTDTEIVVQVPDGAVDGPLQVNTPAIPAVLATPSVGSTPAVVATPAVDSHSDSTIDATGPYLAAFDVNHLQRPGLCSLTPAIKDINTPIALNGLALGASQGSSTVYFNNFVAPSYPGTWTNTLAHATVPNLEASSAAGLYATQVFTGDYLCLDKNQAKIDGKYCQIDSDCDVSNGESCGKSWCSENLKYCSLTTTCDKVTEGVCTDIRVGSNAVNFSATVPSTAAKPLISYIDSGWKACSDGPKKDQQCSKDSECTDVSGATCGRVQDYQICSSARTVSGAYVTCTQDSDCTQYNASDTCGPSSATVCSSGAHKDQYCRNAADCGVVAPAGTSCTEMKTFGPPGQYVTIYGSGFGTAGSVQFLQQGGGGFTADGDTNFPAACSTSYWSDTAITVKVPSKFVSDIGSVSFGAYNLSVSSHGTSSSTTPFTIVTGKPSPGICKIVDARNQKQITSGPVGTPLSFIGEHFGDTKGTVMFTPNVSSAPSTWVSSTSVSDPTSIAGFVLVPNASKTGPVFVVDGASNKSNSLNFQVADCQKNNVCPTKSDICCGDGTCVASGTTCPDFKAVTQFAYKISTNAIPVAPRVLVNCTEDPNQEHPSPAPSLKWSVPENICVNAEVTAAFTEPMDERTLTSSNIIVQKCPEDHKVLTVDPVTKLTSYSCSASGTGINAVPSWKTVTGTPSPSAKAFTWTPSTAVTTTSVCAFKTDVITDPLSPDLYRHTGGQFVSCQSNSDCGSVNINDVCENAKCSLYLNACTTDAQCKGHIANTLKCGTLSVPSDLTSGSLEPSTLYQVTIKGKTGTSTGVQSSPSLSGGAVSMEQDFSWLFYTASSTKPCQVGSVGVSPFDFLSSKINEQIMYLALPLSKNDQCVPLSCVGRSFSWSSDTLAATANAGAECAATVQTNYATPPYKKAKIDASLIVTPAIPAGEGTLAIKPALPSVVDYFPRCSIACLNTFPWVQFSVDMDSASFITSTRTASKADTVKLIKCHNSLCADTLEATEDLVPISVRYTKITEKTGDTFIAHLYSTATLAPNTWYRIVLSSLQSKDQVALQSNYGKPDNGFYPGAFSWKFKTQTSNSLCSIDHVDISPKVSTLAFVGDKQSFYAIGKSAPDECSSSGQDLQGATQWNAWTATDVNPSTGGNGYKTGGATSSDGVHNLDQVTAFMLQYGKIYTYSVPSYCSSSCLNIGSPIKSGQAICGNGGPGGIAPEVGEQCDDGNTVDGVCSSSSVACSKDSDCHGKDEKCKLDGCSSSCLLEGISPTCGNGILDAGEQCDDHNTNDGDGCSSKCLNEGTSKMAGAICGDNVLDHINSSVNGSIAGGEDCDTGGLCGDRITACVVGSTTACDDGSICTPRTDKGCNANCKNTGSIFLPPGANYCGDGTTDPGEDCDLGTQNGKSGSGCSDVCKHTGTLPGTIAGTCGNGGVLDPGEDCDHGINNGKIGDSCTSNCLFAGSSSSYSSPSFCGDGAILAGEKCDASAASDVNYGTGLTVGSFGVAQIAAGARFEVETDKSKSTYGYAISTITASVPGAKKAGTATVQLQCSCTNDASCNTNGGTTLGCGAQNCCYKHPVINAVAPVKNFSVGSDPSTGYCRNTAISISFSDHMDTSTFSTAIAGKDSNIQLELVNADGTPVPEATCLKAYPDASLGFVSKSKTNLLARAIDWIKSVVSGLLGRPVMASAGYKNCFASISFDVVPLNVNATGDGDQVFIRYNSMLAANSYYKLHIKTDVTGVLSTSKVDICEGTNCVTTDKTETFFVGNAVCKLDSVDAKDRGIVPAPQTTQSTSVGVYTSTNEVHEYTIEAQSIRDITGPETISPVAGIYDWVWNWNSSILDSDKTNVIKDDHFSTSPYKIEHFSAVGNNGEENVLGIATIKHVDASLGVDQSVGTEITGTIKEIAFLCSNPWPAISSSDPTYDAENKNGVTPFPFIETSKNTNFSFYYCRDSNDPAHPLPILTKTDSTTFDPSTTPEHILTELVFNVAGTKDAIGVRVLENHAYLSPMAWFKAQHFNATATPTKLDGYQAVQSGNTIYVAAANVNSNVIYSNIYAISYNADAGADAKIIFAQILKNMQLNAGVDLDNASVVSDVQLCKYPGNGKKYIQNAGQFVSCSWDGDCADIKDTCLPTGNCSIPNANSSLNTCKADADCKNSITGTSGAVCDADKSKLIRDTKRLSDVTDMIATFNRYASVHSHCSVSTTQSCITNAECSGTETCLPSYPTIQTGTFVPAMTNSLWPSWNSALANALGASLPTDPINKFWLPCKQSTDPNAPGFDQSSCFNGQTNQFFCPANSHLYGYQSAGGSDITLSTGLEYLDRSWSDPINKTCSNDSSKYCSVNADCSGTGTCKVSNHVTVQVLYSKTPAQPALQYGFTLASNFCDGATSFGTSASCGDGVIGKDANGTQEVCEKGDMNPVVQSCAIDICTAGDSSKIGRACSPDSTNASCDTTSGVGKCTNSVCVNGDPAKYGHACTTDSNCETTGGKCEKKNGIINSTCIMTGAQACMGYSSAGAACVPFACGNGVKDAGEQCDDGALNGTYGHCGNNCQFATGANGFFCGDGKLAGSEQCDCGNGTGTLPAGCTAPNGQYNQSGGNCSYDCKLPGPSCGDGIVNGTEECDGGKVCQDGKTMCDTNADCGSAADAKCSMKPETITYDGKICTTDPAKKCSSDADCGGYVASCGIGPTAACSTVNYCNHASDVGKKCSNASDCQSGTCDSTSNVCQDANDTGNICDLKTSQYTNGTGSVFSCQVGCVSVPRTRSRSCATDNSCKWTSSGAWSTCQEIGTPVCGDGVINGSEECDNGSQNSDNAACTTSCKKNVCGDGHVNVGVESCDAGLNNKTSCSAAYGGTCSFCTENTCKYKTQSGGKCGDNVINGSEVCDGTALPYSCFKSDATSGTGAVDVQGVCNKNDEGKIGGVPYTICSISGKKCDGTHHTCTLPGETCGSTAVNFTNCAAGYTCRFVGVCNGGDKFNENGSACTVPGSVLWGNDDIQNNINWCDHKSVNGVDVGSGTCTPPVCSNTCSTSCPMAFQTIPVQIKSGLIGSQYSDSLTFTPANTQATIAIPACTVGLKLNGTLLNANNAVDTSTKANVLFSAPAAITPPAKIDPLNVVFLIDLSDSMNESYSGVGLGTYFAQAKTYAHNLLVNLHAKVTGSGLAVRVSLIGIYNDGSKSVAINLADGTKTPSFLAMQDNTSYTKLLTSVDAMSPVSMSAPAIVSGILVAKLVANSDTAVGTKSIVTFSTASSLGQSLDQNGAVVDCDTAAHRNSCILKAKNYYYSNVSTYAVGVLSSGYGTLMNTSSETSCVSTAADLTAVCPMNRYVALADKTEEKGTDSVPLPISLTIALANTLLSNGTIPLNASGTLSTSSSTTSQTVSIDQFQDMVLPTTFICTGQPFILPITINPADPVSNNTAGIMLKDLNFTYCPVKP